MPAERSRFDSIMVTAKRPASSSWRARLFLKDESGREYLTSCRGGRSTASAMHRRSSPTPRPRRRRSSSMPAPPSTRGRSSSSPTSYPTHGSRRSAARSLYKLRGQANEGRSSWRASRARTPVGRVRDRHDEGRLRRRTLATMSASDKPGSARSFSRRSPGSRRCRGTTSTRSSGPSARERTPSCSSSCRGSPASTGFRGVRARRSRACPRAPAPDDRRRGPDRDGPHRKVVRLPALRIQPDIITFGKGIAGGAPLGGMVVEHSASSSRAIRAGRSTGTRS